jgi:hypothetical protein
MKVYVTKYALTTGIMEVDAELFANGNAVKWGEYFQAAHGEGKDWHRTRESALKRCELMRARKIKTLRESIAKLEKMTW